MPELQNHSFTLFEAIYHQGIPPQREQSLQHDEPLDHPYLDRKEARSGASVEVGSKDIIDRQDGAFWKYGTWRLMIYSRFLMYLKYSSWRLGPMIVCTASHAIIARPPKLKMKMRDAVLRSRLCERTRGKPLQLVNFPQFLQGRARLPLAHGDDQHGLAVDVLRHHLLPRHHHLQHELHAEIRPREV